MPDKPPTQTEWVEHTQRLLDSYRKWTGVELIDRSGNDEEQAARLFAAPFVVLSHGTEADPILNFGNQSALDLWETDLSGFLTMPSRLTAEPVHRDERQRLLERVEQNGFIDDYSGVRITRTGRRFFIERATVWNVVDSNGVRIGQAATFSTWRFLTDE